MTATTTTLPTTCKACNTNDHAPSAMQHAFCTECVQAMLQGRRDRLDTPPAPIAFTANTVTITDLKRIDHEIDRSSGRPRSEYWGYYDNNFIGVRPTYDACEKMLDAYAYDLLSDGLHIPARTLDGQCGDCGATLNEHGQCERCIEDAEQARLRDAEADEPEPWAAPDEPTPTARQEAVIATTIRQACRAALSAPDPAHDRPNSLTLHPGPSFSIRQPKRCACGQVAIIEEPAGLFCNACHEARCLWQLWRDDPTELVAELRRQSVRLDEMATRLTTYLSRKTGQDLSAESILAIWRNLLGDDDEPRYYLVLA